MIKVALGAFLAVAGLTSVIHYNKDFNPDYDKMMTSVVRISVESEDGTEQGHGSGVILEDGTILSAFHVFETKQGFIKPRFMAKTKDGKYFKLEEVKRDEKNDLIIVKPVAELKIDLTGTGSKLQCEPAHLGDRVISMGSPTILDWITTFGRIGGTRQTPEAVGKPILVSTATLGPGMSGGPTFNVEGEIIGINDAILTSPIGGTDKGFLDFSILVPAQEACELVEPKNT